MNAHPYPGALSARAEQSKPALSAYDCGSDIVSFLGAQLQGLVWARRGRLLPTHLTGEVMSSIEGCIPLAFLPLIIRV